MSAELSLRSFDLRLERTLKTGSHEIRSRQGLAIRVRTSDGVGVGESTPLPGWTESLEACTETLQSATDDFQENDPWRLVLPADAPAARHGLQLAVMDLAARKAELSLARYLGGEDVRNEVAVNATVGDGDTAETVAAVTAAVDAGFRTVKCKVGARSVEADVRRVRAIREAIPAEIELRLDANRAWTINEAKQVMETVEDLNVSYVEEPLTAPTPDALKSLRRSGVGIGLDETLAREAELDAWFEVADAAVLKPMALGGIDRAVEIASAARAKGVRTVVSSTIDAVIARIAAVHLAAALPGTEAAGLATRQLLATDLAADPAPVREGRITVPTDAGIGTLGPWDYRACGGTSP